jgi:hypothetical protein
MTDPTGRCFVSYRRARLGEAGLLVGSLHDYGVPTWQDITNLVPEQTEDELRRTLRDPLTASALLWVTPEVEHSTVIRTIEVPEIKARNDRHDGFFVLPVAAGGLAYGKAAEIISTHVGLDDFAGWNFEKTDDDPLQQAEAVRLAREVLKNRLLAIDAPRLDGQPFGLGIWVRSAPPGHAGDAIQLDWHRHFDGRHAPVPIWDDTLIPALNAVVEAISAENPERGVVAHGQPSLAAAASLGAAFLEPCGVPLTWMQKIPGQTKLEAWDLTATPEPSKVSARFVSGNTDAEDLVVAVSLRFDVEPAIRRGREDGVIPAYRGAVVLEPEGEGATTVSLKTPSQVVDAVEKTIDGIRQAKRRWPEPGNIHLFLSAPVGFAILLGQRLNAFGPIQLYEHEPTDGIGEYRVAGLLRPGC